MYVIFTRLITSLSSSVQESISDAAGWVIVRLLAMYEDESIDIAEEFGYSLRTKK